MDHQTFLFVVCQQGAEAVCKREVARQRPDLKLAFSRPGFLTLKSEKSDIAQGTFVLEATFARTWGVSLGLLRGTDGVALVDQVIDRVASLPIQAIHVWQRDASVPGDRDFEPFVTPLAQEIGNSLAQRMAARDGKSRPVNRSARSGTTVLDVALIEPNEWLVGWHRVQTMAQRWPGGVPPRIVRCGVISRAYYKMAELLEWGRFPLRAGDVCIELGSAPGGAAQRLIEAGAKVVAIDPAVLDDDLMAHPAVTHLRMRSREVPRNKLKSARWLFADLNVAPTYTLDAVEDLVTNRHLHLAGLGLTLKLTKWAFADEIDHYRQRVKTWGFDVVKTRQLAFNRREFCLVALKDKYQARLASRQRTKQSARTR